MNKNKQSRFLGEKKVNGYTLAIYRQPDAREPGCRAFGEVKELIGCVIEGATQKDVLLRAEAAIAEYVKSRENPIKQKPRLVSVKLKPDLYALVLRYAQDQGIESVSTLMRSLVVKKLREDGYDVSTRIAT